MHNLMTDEVIIILMHINGFKTAYFTDINKRAGWYYKKNEKTGSDAFNMRHSP